MISSLIQLFRLQKYKKFESNSQQCPFIPFPKRVVSTAKVQKIWEQFTTLFSPQFPCDVLFRLQKYKKFESNSQLDDYIVTHNTVVSTAKVQKIWEQFTTIIFMSLMEWWLFRLQKYKKFESNSQQSSWKQQATQSCFDCKSTKNLRAIHNRLAVTSLLC